MHHATHTSLWQPVCISSHSPLAFAKKVVPAVVHERNSPIDGAASNPDRIALRDGYRQKVFLMTKFDGRTKDATARQIDDSLQRLQTDRIDLIQYHENIRLEDPDRFFAIGHGLARRRA
jgi:hypothetical protein